MGVILFYPIQLDPNPLIVRYAMKERLVEPNERFSVHDMYADAVFNKYRKRGLRILNQLHLIEKGEISRQEYLVKESIEGYKEFRNFIDEQWAMYMKSREPRENLNMRAMQPPHWLKVHVGDVNGVYTTDKTDPHPKPKGRESLYDKIDQRIDELEKVLDTKDFHVETFESKPTVEETVLSKPIPSPLHKPQTKAHKISYAEGEAVIPKSE